MSKINSDKLWETILEKAKNPDNVKELVDGLSEQEVLALTKNTKHFGKPVYKSKHNFLAFSFIDFGKQIYEKLITTAMIQFLYQLVTEFEPENASSYKSEVDVDFSGCYKKNVLMFLQDKYKDNKLQLLALYKKFNIDELYNALKEELCCASAAGAIGFVQLDETLKEDCCVAAQLDDTLKEDNALSTAVATQLDETLKEDSATHAACGSVEAGSVFNPIKEEILQDLTKDEVDIILANTKKELNVEKTKEEYILEYRIIIKLFLDKYFYNNNKKICYQFDNFYNGKYEDIKKSAKEIYGDMITDLEMSIAPLEVFDTKEEYDKFTARYTKEFDYDVYLAKFNINNILTPINKNKEIVEFSNKNTAILTDMLDKSKADSKIGESIIKGKIEKERKKSKNKDIKDYTEYFNSVNKYDIESVCEEVKKINEPEEPELNEIEMLFNVIAPDKSQDLILKGVSHRYKFNV